MDNYNHNIILTNDLPNANECKIQQINLFDLSLYDEEIELFKDDYSNFFTLFFFIIFDNKRVFVFDRFKDREILEILDDKNLSLYEKLKELKSIKRIYLKINNLFRKNNGKMNQYKILLYNGKNSHFESFMSLFRNFLHYDVTNIFLTMSENQWKELKFQEKSHLWSYITKI